MVGNLGGLMSVPPPEREVQRVNQTRPYPGEWGDWIRNWLLLAIALLLAVLIVSVWALGETVKEISDTLQNLHTVQ